MNDGVLLLVILYIYGKLRSSVTMLRFLSLVTIEFFLDHYIMPKILIFIVKLQIELNIHMFITLIS